MSDPFPRRRALAIDLIGLLVLELALLDDFRPALLFLPTIAAGGEKGSPASNGA